MDPQRIKREAKKAIEAAADLHELDGVYRAYLGSKGELGTALKTLKNMSPAKRKAMGKSLNKVKADILAMMRKREKELKAQLSKGYTEKEWIDVTRPVKEERRGHLHPLTLVIRDIERIFGSMGFEVASGPEIETEYYNFDALNIPKDHPSRDLMDTFWLQSNHKSETRNPKSETNQKSKVQKSEKLLLRTHTSPVQIRYMETHEPPFRIIAPGRCFRHEATDASHNFEFYQFEGLMVGPNVSLAHLKGVLLVFFQKFFRKDLAVRFRPSYFPFTEPSVEVDITCLTCAGKGCSICSKTGWLEMMGAGMVHPNVFKAVKYNPRLVQGFAFGMGIDRLALMRYKIDDIRLLYSGDLRFLKQF